MKLIDLKDTINVGDKLKISAEGYVARITKTKNFIEIDFVQGENIIKGLLPISEYTNNSSHALNDRIEWDMEKL